MGCVHMHQKIPVIQRHGSPNCIRNIVKILGKIIKKLRKFVELYAKHLPQGQNIWAQVNQKYYIWEHVGKDMITS
jgi:hypothetical protein